MRTRVSAIFIAILLLAATAGAEEVYRYTDDRGVVHFVQYPEQIPSRYRKQARTVQGKVQTSPGTVKQPKPALPSVQPTMESLQDLLPDLEAEALPPPLIVAIEWWRSRLLFGCVALAAMSSMFLLGLWWARDIPGARRAQSRRRLVISFTVTLALYWLAIFGPGLGRMLRGCEAEASRSIELADDDSQRARLEQFRRHSEQAAEAVERLLVSPPV